MEVRDGETGYFRQLLPIEGLLYVLANVAQHLGHSLIAYRGRLKVNRHIDTIAHGVRFPLVRTYHPRLLTGNRKYRILRLVYTK